jgi:CRP/FNR family transcriptional regulator, cyclic AMP receptor protein
MTSTSFDPVALMTRAGVILKVLPLQSNQALFSQGSPADAVFYLQTGQAKLTVISTAGKQATIALLSGGEFVGEESIAAAHGLHLATATTVTPCTVLKIRRQDMLRMLHDEHTFSDIFLTFILSRSMRTQADLVDHLFNNSEKRLARILLLMAEFGRPGEQDVLIPQITQEALADMVGTTRSRVSFFMNRFRKMGFIEYDDRIRVHKSLLNIVLHDQERHHPVNR